MKSVSFVPVIEVTQNSDVFAQLIIMIKVKLTVQNVQMNVKLVI
jgi:hypothetical protein